MCWKFSPTWLQLLPSKRRSSKPQSYPHMQMWKSKETTEDPQWNCLWSLCMCGCVCTEHTLPLQLKLNITTPNKWHMYISLCPKGVLEISARKFQKQDSWNGRSTITIPTAEKSWLATNKQKQRTKCAMRKAGQGCGKSWACGASHIITLPSIPFKKSKILHSTNQLIHWKTLGWKKLSSKREEHFIRRL